MNDDTRSLTRAIASGDTEAFARFYRQWFDFVFAIARRCGGRDEQSCLDIVQDVMLRVIRSIKPMNSEADVQRWLAVVTTSVCCDGLRRERRRLAREWRAAGGAGSRGESIEETDERLAWMRRELRSLPGDQAKLLTLRFRFDWTLKRIAVAMGLKTGAVDGRLSRAIASLRLKAQEKFND